MLRHFVNKLVKYATGVDSATKTATRQVFAAKRRRWNLGDQLIANCGHHLTDVGSWPRLRAAGQAALTAMAAMSSQRMFTGMVTRRAPIAVQVPTPGALVDVRVRHERAIGLRSACDPMVTLAARQAGCCRWLHVTDGLHSLD